MKIIMAVLQFQMLESLNQIFSFLFQNLGLCRLVALSKAQTDRYLSPNSQCERQKVEVAQLCLTLWDPMDYSLPASSVHGILQARILEWVATPYSRGSSWPRDWTWVSSIAGRFFTMWATREHMAQQEAPRPVTPCGNSGSCSGFRLFSASKPG